MPREIAVAFNLVPCFTPFESPESNGMAEAFGKTFKRDYPIPNAAAKRQSLMDLAKLCGWVVEKHDDVSRIAERLRNMTTQNGA